MLLNQYLPPSWQYLKLLRSVIFWVLASQISLAAKETSANNLRLTWEDKELLVVEHDKGLGLALQHKGKILLHSPKEGLWSIGIGWKDSWPELWAHGHATNAALQNDWLILTGEIKSSHGTWRIRDSYRIEGGQLRGVRRWERRGQAAKQATLSVRWHTPGTGDGVTMPAVMYHGNPSGRRSNSAGWKGIAPLYDGRPGNEGFYEEHRFAAPFISLEWHAPETKAFGHGIALHSLPSRTPYAIQKDQWWSMGISAHQNYTELALQSGLVSINGLRGHVKSGQSSTSAWGPAYLDIPGGAIIEKTFLLEGFEVTRKGSGFQTALKSSIAYFNPFSTDGMPSYEEIIQSKFDFSSTRWSHPAPERSGFAMYPDKPNLYVMGWAGQAEAPGYALLVLADRLPDPANVRLKAQLCLDTLSRSPFNADGFLLAVDGKSGTWSRQDPISQGQAMDSFANAVRFGRRSGADTSKWETFLKRACDVHAGRLLAAAWSPASTNEAFLIAPLCKASVLFDKPLYRRAAIKAADYYTKRHIDMREPYWGGTLDARCEDKEGAWAAFQAFLAVYEMTEDESYLIAAEHACDVVLTYTFLWDVDMPPGRLADHAFKSRGWSSVSVQNMHLDVYAVLFTPEIYRLGIYTKRDNLKRLAEVMYRSCGQMIDQQGSQGEQLNHTNFVQGMPIKDVHQMRGTYHEDWTVYWIAAHFLTAAAKFEEIGVNLRDTDK